MAFPDATTNTAPMHCLSPSPLPSLKTAASSLYCCFVSSQSHGYKAWAEDEALEEAQAAVTEIVLPLGQPVELMPRAGTVLEAQVGVWGTGGGRAGAAEVHPGGVNAKRQSVDRRQSAGRGAINAAYAEYGLGQPVAGGTGRQCRVRRWSADCSSD